ncbi:MAG: ABC transporter permease [Candidatus Cloacimonetes bacterium]|nr:ABC transporter permease [Candidatus Cloacimonadota bacterium]
MFLNYLRIAFRNIWRQKTYSAINIGGFAIGLAVCLIISFYVIDDLTYDNFHDNAENIYHLLTVDNSEDEGALSYSITSGPLVAGMADAIPEIIAATRVTVMNINLPLPENETETDQQATVNVMALMADSSFFDVFSFKILASDQIHPLNDSKGVYLSENLAEMLYPESDPVGKPFINEQMEDAFVAGIISDVPHNSHLQFDLIAPLSTSDNPVWWESWENLALIGYFRIYQEADPQAVLAKLKNYATQNGFAEVFAPAMQPLLDVHLGSAHLRYDYLNQGKTDRMKVYTLAIVALLVLIIASINFINLSSARAARRALEVGIRKVVGGNRKQLFRQFIGESILTTFIAMLIALVLFEISLPYLNNFLQKDISYDLIENYKFSIFILIMAVTVGFLAGLYPASILSSFTPVKVLKGKFSTSKKGIIQRVILVVLQFSVSIALIISVLIVLDQVKFLQKTDLGYNKNNVLVLRNVFPEQSQLVKEQIEDLSFVEGVATVTNLPGGTLVRLEVIPEGYTRESGMMFDRLMIDDELINVLKIDLIEGRNFDPELATDPENSVLINEAAARKLNWANPIGKKITMIDQNEDRLQRTVIGVVKDFNFTTARRQVNPMIIPNIGQFFPRYLVRLQNDDPANIQAIEDIFHSIDPEAPFNANYLEDIFSFQFQQDLVFAQNITIFAALAVFIASLGLFGLASFTAQQRRREVAVRKVLGAPVSSIVVMMSKDFARWVLMSNIIAWPLAYFVMKNWLSNFVYQTQINWLIFVAAGFTALIIAMITVSFHVIHAAGTNPVLALKYE